LARDIKKYRENFSVLGRKLLQSLWAEAGQSRNRKLSSKVFLKKGSSFVVNLCREKCGQSHLMAPLQKDLKKSPPGRFFSIIMS